MGRASFLILFLMAGFLAKVLAQDSVVRPSDLPSADSKSKVPELDSPAAEPNMMDAFPQESPSIPKLRAPEKDTEKLKEQDWAAQAMLQKKEEAKKREQEQAALADQKLQESQLAFEQQKKEKEERAKAATQPTVARSSVPGFGESDAGKLPAVTGLDGVKPRAMPPGDGRVQPGFDSFTGPSSSGPLGKDFQSGARPIMPGGSTVDGRMQMPSQPPQPPSGAYKRISQDPNTYPPGYGEKKPATPSRPAVTPTPVNPPSSGDTKRVIDTSKAGYSPYDNSKLVPDPRSQRRF